MDMARTSVNLLGNCLATAVVARWEGVDLNAVQPIPIAEAASA
jgi:proton glutamate symport protein